MSKTKEKEIYLFLQALLGVIKSVVMPFVWLLVSVFIIYALFVFSDNVTKYYVTLSDFDEAERLGLVSIEQLNQEKAETLIIYRRKKF